MKKTIDDYFSESTLTKMPIFNGPEYIDKLISKNYFRKEGIKSIIEIFNEKNTSIEKYMVNYSTTLGYSLYKIKENKSGEIPNYHIDDFKNIMNPNHKFKVYNPNTHSYK